MRLRSTAFFAVRFDTVKPKRGGPCPRRGGAPPERKRAARPGGLSRRQGSRASSSGARSSVLDRSRRQALAPLGAAAGEHLASVLRRHAGAKSVAALTHQAARLIGSLHRPCRLAGGPRLRKRTAGSLGFQPRRADVRNSAGAGRVRKAPVDRARYRVKPAGKSTTGDRQCPRACHARGEGRRGAFISSWRRARVVCAAFSMAVLPIGAAALRLGRACENAQGAEASGNER